MHNEDEKWMQKAIAEAKLGNTPFGAVIVNENNEYVTAFNTTKQDGPVAHAEMNAIQKLNQLTYGNSKTLKLYTTVEPCPMCMSALVWAGIGHLIYGASIADAAQFGKQIHITSAEVSQKSWYSIKIQKGVEREACLKLFKQ